MKKTIEVPVAEITADLKDGIPDEEIMNKYGLSEEGLKKVFGNLLNAMSNGSRQIHIRVQE